MIIPEDIWEKNGKNPLKNRQDAVYQNLNLRSPGDGAFPVGNEDPVVAALGAAVDVVSSASALVCTETL